ncbi:MAG: cyclodeaminase/cyclohydrolase family protein [Bacillota bacterium]|jgi:formiminotetrahydrofolate cyclodeaminase|nr:cyclodeaminase/cyclohydrolase family protein [Bacillota bacterium]NLV69385.1 cyclodeaminase/cyclohydrolase family protein [Clostridiales bacterium]
MNKAQSMTISEWTDALSSAAPIPGGGGVGALLGVLSACLASMVGNLTVEKKGYEAFSLECEKLIQKANELRNRLLQLIDEDAIAFEALMKAWKTGANDQAYANASEPAARTIHEIVTLLDILNVFKEKGNKNVLSDVGVGACCAAAALETSRINILVNLRYIGAPNVRKEFEMLLDVLIPEGIKRARDLMKQVERELQ